MTVAMQGVHSSVGRNTVLRGVDLVASPGHVTGLLGPNGAGKSTSLRVLLGLLRPESGTVSLFGRPWERSALARVGSMVDGPSFYPHLTGRQNLELHAALLGTGRSETDRVLALTGLTGAAGQRAKQYSTGMRNRLGLAIALLGEPELIVLDEPQNGLDPEGIRQVRRLIRGLADQGRTVVLSSHVLGEVAAVADQLTCIFGGKTVYSGPTRDLAPDGDLESAYVRLGSRASA